MDDATGAVLTPDGVRQLSVDMSEAALARLGGRAGAVAQAQDPVRAFAQFADIEDAFEPGETSVQEALVAIDREIQMQMDIARGK